jgi:hypothetical protein
VSTTIFITRRDDPLEEAGPRISEAEWREVVARDPEMKLHTGGPVQWFPPRALLAQWNCPDGDPLWFALIDGNVEVRYIGDEMMRKAGRLAGALRAQVISENGERFSEDGTSLGLPDD